MMEILKAHQRIIREQKAQESVHHLFGNEWDGLNVQIENSIVRPIPFGVAENIINEYEWLGCMPAITYFCYGIYFDGVCGGVVVYSNEYAENLGVWDKYGYTGKILLLSRGACVHWAHPHSASRLIAQSMKLLPSRYTVVTATADEAAGEIGTIYQACNFHYVGRMREPGGKLYERYIYVIDGKQISERQIRRMVGTENMDEVRKKYPQARQIKQRCKARYFSFRGSKKEKKANLVAIAHLLQPYPKRTETHHDAHPRLH